MNILFYFPSNKRTIPIDTGLFALRERGHTIHLLTTCAKGPLHDLYKDNGIEFTTCDTSNSNRLVRFVRNILCLIRVCKKYRIDVVHSHLQQTNLVAVIARFFVRARIVAFRHHCKFHFVVDDPLLTVPLNERMADRIINRLAEKIIVPAHAIRKVMIERESVAAEKIEVIPYMYDFEKMRTTDKNKVEAIRSRYKAQLLIIMVSRLTPFKRHEVALEAMVNLIRKGLDIQVMIMDEGPLYSVIQSRIAKEKMQDRVHLLGFQHNILDYIDAADMIIHPSLTEASNSAIKEAGILEKLVLVCDGVGDFNDYLEHQVNGFLLSPSSFTQEAQQYIKEVYFNKAAYDTFGKRLRESIIQKFGIREEIIRKYEVL